MTTPENYPHNEADRHPGAADTADLQPSWAELHPELASGRQAAQVIEHAVSDAPLRRVLHRVEEGYLRYGIPFAAYLRLDDTNLTDERLLERFETAYTASFANLDDAVDNDLDGLGWNEELHMFCTRHGIEPQFLTWDYAELSGWMHSTYDIVELDGWVHLFYR